MEEYSVKCYGSSALVEKLVEKKKGSKVKITETLTFHETKSKKGGTRWTTEKAEIAQLKENCGQNFACAINFQFLELNKHLNHMDVIDFKLKKFGKRSLTFYRSKISDLQLDLVKKNLVQILQGHCGVKLEFGIVELTTSVDFTCSHVAARTLVALSRNCKPQRHMYKKEAMKYDAELLSVKNNEE